MLDQSSGAASIGWTAPQAIGMRMLSTPPRLQPLELFGAGRRLRDDPPEVAGSACGGSGDRAEREQRPRPGRPSRHALPLPGASDLAHRVSSPSARRARRAAPLAPLPDHHGPSEIAASAGIAIRIGISGEEPPSLCEVGFAGLVAVLHAPVAGAVSALPCWATLPRAAAVAVAGAAACLRG